MVFDVVVVAVDCVGIQYWTTAGGRPSVAEQAVAFAVVAATVAGSNLVAAQWLLRSIVPVVGCFFRYSF